MNSLNKMHAWQLVKPPQYQVAVGSKRVFDLERDKKQNMARHGAKLVVEDFSRLRGVNFTEVYSSVSKYVPVRLTLTPAIQFGWN